MTDYERVSNYLRFGEYGDWVEMENGKKAIRVSSGRNTLPFCKLYDNGKYIKEESAFSETMKFLLGD